MADYICPYRVKTSSGYRCPIRGACARSQIALGCDPADNAECARRYAAAATAPLRAEIKEHDRARKGASANGNRAGNILTSSRGARRMKRRRARPVFPAKADRAGRVQRGTLPQAARRSLI